MTLKDRLTDAVRSALAIDQMPEVQWQVPKRTDLGDLATNIAMVLAKTLGKNPREIAERIVEQVDWESLGVERVEIAGPGFLNLFLGSRHFHDVVRSILREGPDYGKSDSGGGRSVLVEYVSANPTGPLNVVSARAAAIGDSIVRLLRKAGWKADAEFYVNDAGRQVRRFGESIIARVRGVDVPEDGYHGEDVIARAHQLFPDGTIPDDADPEEIGRRGAELNVADQRKVLETYGVSFDRWYYESELHGSGAPMKTLSELKKRGAVAEREGALWFQGTSYGDTEDRVIVTSEGRPTYFLPDIAYHLSKAQRGYSRAVDLLGPDHHDYVGRMQAALRALGYDGFLEVLIVQQVHLIESGEKVKMSKRAGKLVTLEELVEEVGKDVARYFFLQRRTSSPLDFDLDLAREQSDRNPVFYVQYAHTRIAGILRQDGCPAPAVEADLSPLNQETELDLIRHLEQFPEVIARAAESYEPQKMVGYLAELATRFHKFYTSSRVVGVQDDVSLARASLAEAARIVLAEGLNLLGVSAPERM
ncbi:MAG: arginine--tRNA ligase [bacterium]